MSYFVYTYDGCSNGCDVYRIQPGFTPRRVESGFGSLLTAAANQRSADQLTAEQKEVLRKRLNNGQGVLTLQQWDDYLADLEELGMISHDDRFYANGILQQIPETTRGLSGAESVHDAKDRYWNGDPLQWLRDMGRISTALSSQRSAYQRVENITRDILGPGGDNFTPRTSTINANQFRSAWLQSRTAHLASARREHGLQRHV